jgi:hypothetical protein
VLTLVSIMDATLSAIHNGWAGVAVPDNPIALGLWTSLIHHPLLHPMPSICQLWEHPAFSKPQIRAWLILNVEFGTKEE